MRAAIHLARWPCLVMLVSCTAAPQAPEGALSGKLVLTGSSTVAPLAAEIARRFEELHPGVRVDVQTGGSSRGIADARSGIADLGMVSRELAADEADLLAFPLARDGLGIIVHADNSVAGLSDEQLVAIYTGEMTDWSQVGGAPGPITVVHKADGRATLEVFMEHLEIDRASIRADLIVGDNQQGIKTVAGDPWAIAYVSIGAADWEIRNGASLRLLPLGDVAPTLEALAAGELPMTRPLNLVARGEPTGLAAVFVGFACSDAVRDLVEAQLFVPVTES